MSHQKDFIAFILIPLIIFIASIDITFAGERVKGYATSVTTKWIQMDISDVDGHVIAIYEAKQVWFDSKTGEESTAVSNGILDTNFQTGVGSVTGYAVRTFKDGEKIYSKYEGKPVGEGQTEGTFIYTGGTGKFKGLKGGGTWKNRTLASGITYSESEGEREYQMK